MNDIFPKTRGDSVVDGLKKCVALCILKNKDNYLLIKRGKSKTTKEDDYGMYIPIGGKFEPFETPEEAAKREVKEETGLDIDNIEFKGMIIESSKANYNWVDFVYISEIPYFDPIDTDEGYLEWVHKDDIDTLPTPEIDKYVYKYIVDNQKFIFNDVYDSDLNLIYAKEELSGKIIVNRS